MPTDAVVLSLKSLKLFDMAGAVAELAEQGAPAYHQSTGLLDQLIKAEVADREVRSINYQMRVSWQIPLMIMERANGKQDWSFRNGLRPVLSVC